MRIHKRFARFLAEQEYKSQVIQREHFIPLKRAILPFKVEEIIPSSIFLANPDPTTLIRVYHEEGFDEKNEPKMYLHLVFSDEVFPLSKEVDKYYRQFRKESLGRIADVESLEIAQLGSRYIGRFVSTYTGPNIYETSVHLDGSEAYTREVYINTWNHLMSCIPAGAILLRYGYKEAKDYKILKGTRKDAEEYASKVG